MGMTDTVGVCPHASDCLELLVVLMIMVMRRIKISNVNGSALFTSYETLRMATLTPLNMAPTYY